VIETAPTNAHGRVVYTNALLQLPDREALGTIVVENGRIADIAAGFSRAGVDLGGAICMPGLVELHTDNIETVLAPRPGVRWPLELAAQYHDRIVVAAGITTVCDAIALGDTLPGSARLDCYAPIIDVIGRGVAQERYAADHLIHLRCELVYDELISVVERFIDDPLVALLSVMDHTPGQRQFADLEKFEQYYAGKYRLDRAGIERIIAGRVRDAERHAARNRDTVVALARERGIPVATHDDATAEHVADAVRDGAVIAEFPTTLEAARAARDAGLLVLMGAPNLVLGGSQSGNVSALELARRNMVDIFSSDYVPQSLLSAPLAVAAATGAPLHETMRSVTVTPARAIGLDDRGELAIGQRADLVFVEGSGTNVRVTGVVCNGRRVA
jgi:alpha-D-ribose 1-methylphosphonate 5-triphosphate diphosphatase